MRSGDALLIKLKEKSVEPDVKLNFLMSIKCKVLTNVTNFVKAGYAVTKIITEEFQID